MKRFLFFLIALFFFFSAIPAFASEAKIPPSKSKNPPTVQGTKFLDTTYHALIIGNNQYKHLPKLKTACNDAVEVEKLLKEKLGFQTELLLDASRIDILGRINQMRKRLGEKDSLLIYYAGHGEYDKTVDKSYWLPVDAQRDDPSNWIMADDITSNIKRIAARHVLVVSDSCYSGTLGRQAVTEMITTGERDEYLKKMQERPSRTLMASGGNEPVSDSGGGNNSVFAAAFIKAMKESDKTQFSAEEIFHTRIKAIVAGKSDQVPEYSSIRNSGDEGGDFVFRLAKMEVEPTKTATDIKVQSQEEDKQYDEERKKIDEERRRLEVEKAQLEKDRKRIEKEQKLEEERQKLAEEQKQIEEAKKVLAKHPTEIPKDFQDSVTGMEFVLIPSGHFTMGSPEHESGRYDNEGPQHEVTFSRQFYLGKYEVTVGQFRRFVQEKGYKTEAETGGGTYIWNRGKGKWEIKKGAYWDNPGFNQTDRHPVTCVSWNDAQAFIKWLNKKTGSSYRLPSEAEWEYAARAGTKTARFWGDDPNDACSYANVADQTKSPDGKFQWSDIHECTDGYWFTAPVGSFHSNAFGLYDMLGNVSEWCQDVYGNYTAGSLIDPQAFVPSGIGVKLKLQDGIITIVELSKGQPAEQAGLRPGDTIMQINDKITKNMKVAEAVSLIGGANGTMVTLTIIHEGEKEPKKFTLTREPLEIGVLRVLRGGSWENVARLLRAAYRVEFIPDVRTNSFGFRVARDLY